MILGGVCVGNGNFAGFFIHSIGENCISFFGVAYENVGDCANQLSILDNWAAAHSLDNAARFRQKLRVGYANDHISAVGGIGQVDFFDGNRVLLGCFSFYGAENICVAYLNLLTHCKGDSRRINGGTVH